MLYYVSIVMLFTYIYIRGSGSVPEIDYESFCFH
jgi:hypothetical protein